MFTIAKQYHFSASHQLAYLPEDHPCARLHGHNYIVEVELQSEELNHNGFVRDYRELDALKTYIDETFDHRHLNEVLGEHNITAEQIDEFLKPAIAGEKMVEKAPAGEWVMDSSGWHRK